MTRHVYSAWDGHQSLDVPRADDILHALSDDLLRYGDLDWALQELLRRGYTGSDGQNALQGFDDLLRQLETARDACLQRYSADSFCLSDRQVKQFQDTTATAASAVTSELTPFHQSFPAARAQRQVQEDALQHRYQMVQDRLDQRRSAPPEKWDTEMAQHLQRLLDNVQPAPRYEPENEPENEPDLLEDEVRTERTSTLLQYRAQLLRRLHANLNALDRYLDRVERIDQQLEAFPFCGNQPLGLEAAERLLKELHYLDSLIKRTRWNPGTTVTFDLEQLQILLREASITPTPQLQELETLLEQAGLVRKTAEGLHLTAQGSHQIGSRVLHDLFRQTQPMQPPRASWRYTSELRGDSKPYEFGDALSLNLSQTLSNATRRRSGVPVQLHPDDFEVYRYEPLTQQATVLALDMSHSMEHLGQHRFTAAKKVALALAQLIRAHFPRDLLYVVGFGDTAQQLQPTDLPHVTVNREHTNTQAGLQLARRLLGRQRCTRKQIVLITDGRPTAARHDGQLYSHTHSLHPVILEETFKEAKRCRQQGMTLNTFMLANDVPLVEFVRQLTAVSQGRAFYTTPEHLGGYVIEDYLNHRKRRSA